MTIKVYNTLSGQIEEFVPLKGDKIGMYVCGPTVYDKGHLGHGRSMVAFDLIRRYFLYKGFEVEFVTNFTDIDDKMINRALEEKISVKELANKIIPIYEEDFKALNILTPTTRPLATEFIERMLIIISNLIEKGVAYEIVGDGIYFDVSHFKEYGKLSKQDLDNLQHGARIAVKDEKKNLSDFVLWKYKKPNEPFWSGEKYGIADGRPGWHIECSAMTYDLLGETFDIHAGGQDLIFPHHECEIAQSESYTGETMAKYWMHNGFVNIEGEKMSKSLNNFTTLQDTFEQFSPLVVRFLLLSIHYRSPIDFNEKSLQQAEATLNRLYDFYWRIVTEKVKDLSDKKDKKIEDILLSGVKDFESSMNNDFEISGAVGAVFTVVKKINSFIDEFGLSKVGQGNLLKFLTAINNVLGILDLENTELDSEIKQLIELRKEARLNKNYEESDRIRDLLNKQNIQTIDTLHGSFYRKGL